MNVTAWKWQRILIPRRTWLTRALILAAAYASVVGPVAANQSGPTPSAKSLSKFRRNETPVPNRYIVVLRATSELVPSVAGALVETYGGTIRETFSYALQGFSVEMTESEAQTLSENPSVDFVEEDGVASTATTQTNAPWGLDRIDQRDRPLDAQYTYGGTGLGVNVYVIDSGLSPHNEYVGRASVVGDTVGSNGVDCNGHGTHVAGIIGGSTYGVAKQATLLGVRVLDCGGFGTTASIIAGVDLVTSYQWNRPEPAVANMSLQLSASSALDLAVTNSSNSGITYVVAAGNFGNDACLTSPARAPGALTVAASDGNDVQASFSNFGVCVDLFAPGVLIPSAWIGASNAVNTLSGTSQASPHAAGLAAKYLQNNPTAPPSSVYQWIRSMATAGHISFTGPNTPNLLLYSPPAPLSPSNLIATPSSVINLAWTDNSTNETAFKIERRSGSGAYAQIATTGANQSTYADNSASAGVTYFYRVRASNGEGNSGYSNEAQATIVQPPTIANVTANPTNVQTGAVQTITWTSTNQLRFEAYRCDALGNGCQLIASGNPSTAQTASWAVPATLALGTYKIRVRVFGPNATSVDGLSNTFSVRAVWVSFQFATTAVTESAGTTSTGIMVRTSDGAPLTSNVRVDYVTADGTATAPADYGSVTGTATFVSGAPNGSVITVPTSGISVVNDIRAEATEDFRLILQNTAGCSLDPARPGYWTHLFQVLDDDDNDAAFVSQSVPTAMAAGNVYRVSVTMRNIGRTTWTAAGGYRLGSANDNLVWGVGRVELPAAVPPGGEATFSFTVMAPSNPGTYNFQWRMVQDGVQWLGDPSTNVAVVVHAPIPNDAAFVSQAVPGTMAAGGRYNVSVTMRNVGTNTWGTASLHRLGSASPQGGTTWGLGRVELPASVPPGSEVTFAFLATAPSTPGSYNFQWQMLQEGIEWFGQASADVVVSVHVPLPNDAAFVSQSMPAEMFAGRQYGVTAVMRNVGTNAWTSAGAYRLGATNPQGNTLWGLGRVELPAAVPPGGEVIFNFAVTAPPNPGTYDLQWQMVQDGVEWFGDTTANRSVHVVEAPPPSVSIRDVGVVEGNPAVFIVTLDWPSQQPITVHYATEDCSAGVSAADYQSTSGILTFDPNVTSRSVIVPTLTRAGDQGTRLFKLMLTTPVNATIADGSGQGIVRDSSPSGPLPPARADFNGDGKTDILWRDPSGNNQVWFMNDMERIGGVSLSPVADPNWKVAATADFNGDGRTDILWRNYSTGVNVVWFMDGSTLTGGAFLTPVTDTNWAVMGSGDFNGDGKADIVWRHQLSGDNQVWYLNGTDGTILGGDVLPSVAGVAWTIGAVGDFNGDGKPDIFWHYQAMAPGGNRVYQHGSKIWLMNGAAVVSEVVLGQLAPPWRVAASGDFTSDGRTDLLWQNETTGALLLWEMNGTTVSCQSSLSPDDHLPPELGWRMVGPR